MRRPTSGSSGGSGEISRIAVAPWSRCCISIRVRCGPRTSATWSRRASTPTSSSPTTARSLRARRSPLVLENGSTAAWRGSTEVRAVAEGSVILPLRWGGELVGLLAIGSERSGESYTSDDLELMETVGGQAAAAIATAQLSESRARSRELGALHRLTSLVGHDLKNSITALS